MRPNGLARLLGCTITTSSVVALTLLADAAPSPAPSGLGGPATPSAPSPPPSATPSSPPASATAPTYPYGAPQASGAPSGYYWPGGYVYGPQEQGRKPKKPPKQLPYEPGQPIPPGYQPDKTMLLSLVIAGASVAGGFWIMSGAVGSIFYGACQNNCKNEAVTSGGTFVMWIPLAGPAITIATADSKSAALDAVLVADTVIQTGAIVMLIAGAMTEKDILVWQGDGARLLLTPRIGAGSGGLGLGAQF